METWEREQIADFNHAARKLGGEKARRLFVEMFKDCIADGMTKAGARQFAVDALVGQANW